MENLPTEYTYLKDENADLDSTVFLIKEVTDASSAKEWLKKWSFLTKMTWRKERTYPKSGRNNIFKIDLKCQHAEDKRLKNLRASKKMGCLAKLQIIVRRCPLNMNSLSDIFLHDWPTQVTLRGKHCHTIENREALKYRDMSEKTVQKLSSLFQLGHSTASALHCLKTDLLNEYGPDYCKVSCDGYYLPSVSVAHKLFRREFSKKQACNDREKMKENLKNMLDMYNHKGSGKVKYFTTQDNNHYFIIICTPIMLQAHYIPQAKELVFVDSFGNGDKERHKLYLFYTVTPAGGLPVAAIISDSSDYYVFDEALACLIKELPVECFYGQSFPKVFLINNDLLELESLKKHFHKSDILQCQFNFLKSMWSWLNSQKNNIHSSNRQHLYSLVKSVLYSETEDHALQAQDVLLSDEIAKQYTNFLSYFLNKWDRRQDWATCYRDGLSRRCTNTANYVEVVFRVINNRILKRVTAFNLTELVNFIVTRYEIYLEKRLSNFCNDSYCNFALRNMLIKETEDKFTVLEKGKGIYMVSNKNEIIEVDITNGQCSCTEAITTKICCHSSEVYIQLDENLSMNFKFVTDAIKETLVFMATKSKLSCEGFESMVSTSKVELSTENFDYTIPYNSPPIVSLPDEIEAALLNFSENSLTPDEEEEFEIIISRMANGVKEDPLNYVPAIRQFLKNVREYGQTESEFLSGLHNFGQCQIIQGNQPCDKLVGQSSKPITVVLSNSVVQKRHISNYDNESFCSSFQTNQKTDQNFEDYILS